MGLGTNQAHTKRISQGSDEATANGTYFTIQLAQTVVFTIACIAAFVAWTLILDKDFTQATTTRLLWAVFVFNIALALRQPYYVTFQAHRRTALSESMLFIDTIITAAGFGTVALVWRHTQGSWVPFRGWAELWTGLLGFERALTVEEGAILLVAAFVTGTLVSQVWGAAIFLKHRYPLALPTRESFRSYIRFAAPLVIVSVFNTLFHNIDIVIVGYFWLNANTADYKTATRLLVPALVFGRALGTLLFPTISELHAKGDTGGVAHLVTISERYLSMILVGLMTLPLVFAEEGLHVVTSDQYLSAADTLRYLLPFLIFQGLLFPMTSLIMGYDRPRSMAKYGIIITSIVVALDLLLVPKSILGVPLAGMKADGAAIGTSIALVIGYLYMRHLVRRHENLPMLPRGFTRHLAAAAVTTLLLWLAKTNLDPSYFDRFWELGAVAVVAGAIYLSALILLNEFTREDWHIAKEIIHPGKMRSYFVDELRARNRER
jgi:O-antigen/teichoic acid export membrane protein